MNYKDLEPPIVIEDNVECMKILVDLGVLDLMTPKPGTNSSYHCYTTSDHYCMASYHVGHGTDKDDGYLIIMAPKTSWSFQKAAEFFSYAISETTEGISYGYKKIPQKQNN